MIGMHAEYGNACLFLPKIIHASPESNLFINPSDTLALL